ncbi:hypothetical protein PHLGIDRAFT_214007 [Phlebiopsis gigantea 11061_1 CR5-6]|uniref:RRM domain-containing protein n=1 Tax=Phlebiopsis gigantea (strain 11061_1 CR5-6) TaxID=745531 RepID=A0A0C3S697_PHLG1|nr:hypothetical protein PHLGIDRAFT_214007 [Phlebiopsis gigantea 11061_1 CR5-6]
MAFKQRRTPHPLIKRPTLWAADVPTHLTWSQLSEFLQPCGQVTSGGVITTTDGRRRWAITFSDTYHAEMALATLHGLSIPNLDPPWTLALSHTFSLDSPFPKEMLCGQSVVHSTKDHPIRSASAQDLFSWFRVAGPLVSVQAGVDVGYRNPTFIIQYWDEKHAQFALRKARQMHDTLKNMPPFILHTVVPWAISVKNMGITFRESDIPGIFGQFGTIIHSKAALIGEKRSRCYVSFLSADEARNAMAALNHTTVDEIKLEVRTLVLDVSDDFCLRNSGDIVLAPHHYTGQKSKPNTSPADPSEPQTPSYPTPQNGRPPSPATDDDANTARDEKVRLEQEGEAQRQRVEEAQRRRVEEARRRRDEELRRVRGEETRREREDEARCRQVVAEYQAQLVDAACRREAAVQAATKARLRMADAEATETAAQAALAEAQAGRAEVLVSVSKADAAVAAARDVLNDALAAQFKALERLAAANTVRAQAHKEEKAAAAERASAERWAAPWLVEERDAQQEMLRLLGEIPPEVLEARRREEIEVSVRKMKELREMEEKDRREKARREQEEREQRRRQEQLEREEAERRKKEAERKAREESERKLREEVERKEREERERLEARTMRLHAYRLAAAKEVERCRKRDMKYNAFGALSMWTHARSVQWFKDVSVDFDNIQFSRSQPLVFESVPWPMLIPPHKITLEDVEWGAVEAFFAAARLVVAAEVYKEFVEKAHRRFHPDRWRARGLLNTILDEDFRQQLETAGNVVAQAITPIWLQTKAEMM